MPPKQVDLSHNAARASRRNFIKETAMATSALALPSWGASPPKGPTDEWIRRAEEASKHLAYFDPAEGPVPNPGMGVNAYVFSDHMHVGYSGGEWNRTQGLPPLPLERATFDRMVQMPYIDNLYVRFEWRDVQKRQGKLELPEAWKWVLEAADKSGKRWSFRIMNCSPHSMAENGLPEFLQGRFKMIPFWHGDNVPGPRPKYFPEYSDEYLKCWGEFVELLGAEFDKHPLLEYVDISGYGFWGEMHHYARYTPEGRVTNYEPPRERVEVVIDRLIRDHLEAFPKTPAVLGLHAADYVAGQRAFQEGLCWTRRDSFMSNFSTAETRLAQGLQPGSAMVWETIIPGVRAATPANSARPLPQRYFDIAAHYVAVGFDPWDTIWAHENRRDIYETLEQRIGYRLRPSIVWRRRFAHGHDELVLGLRNDGCSAPPGQITIQAHFPDGSDSSLALPTGEPTPGAMKIYALPLLVESGKQGADNGADLSMKIQIKGKKYPAQWAVRTGQTADPFVLKVPLNA
jgi:hypothetical protein